MALFSVIWVVIDRMEIYHSVQFTKKKKKKHRIPKDTIIFIKHECTIFYGLISNKSLQDLDSEVVLKMKQEVMIKYII